MRDPKNDVDTFIIDKFTQNGIDNIYGPPIEAADTTWDIVDEDGNKMKLVDTTIKTYRIGS